ncbi:MAG: hypothetical protein B6V02_01825 [Thermoprotei archaeon ex4572_64]|nr:MAG: hypothetical protein B6V02_01825 [Thermoprotei archaeon ex4572_64]
MLEKILRRYLILTELSKNPDPHLDDKLELEHYFQRLVEQVSLDKVEDTLELLEIAANANAVDVPMREYEVDTKDILQHLRHEVLWLGIDKSYLKKLMESRIDEVVYLLDNAGEFVIDKLLIKKLTDMGFKVKVVVREKPYEIDVTYDYAVRNLNEEVELISTGSNYPFFSTNIVNKLISNSSMIISKGIANLESYMERPVNVNAVFLLKVKCKPIAKYLNVDKYCTVITSSNYVLKFLKNFNSIQYFK